MKLHWQNAIKLYPQNFVELWVAVKIHSCFLFVFGFCFAQANVLRVTFLRQLYTKPEETVCSYVLTSKHKLRGKLEITGKWLAVQLLYSLGMRIICHYIGTVSTVKQIILECCCVLVNGKTPLKEVVWVSQTVVMWSLEVFTVWAANLRNISILPTVTPGTPVLPLFCWI